MIRAAPKSYSATGREVAVVTGLSLMMAHHRCLETKGGRPIARCLPVLPSLRQLQEVSPFGHKAALARVTGCLCTSQVQHPCLSPHHHLLCPGSPASSTPPKSEGLLFPNINLTPAISKPNCSEGTFVNSHGCHRCWVFKGYGRIQQLSA